MAFVCIDCSGDREKWVDSRSVDNPVLTDWCSVCNHRKDVVHFPARQDDKENPGTANNNARTKPCSGCKHALESEEPNRNSFSNCHLCKRTHKDYFERTASPVA